MPSPLISGHNWLRERGSYERLRGQVVDFVRLGNLDSLVERGLVHEVAVDQPDTVEDLAQVGEVWVA